MEEQKSLADLTLGRERQNEIPDGWREVDGPEGVRVFRRTSAMTEDRVPTPARWTYLGDGFIALHFPDQGDVILRTSEGEQDRADAQRWLRSASAQPAPALDVAVRALETIKRDEGKVCEQFETCTHPACSSSYSAWAIADATLRHIARLGSAPSRSEPEDDASLHVGDEARDD